MTRQTSAFFAIILAVVTATLIVNFRPIEAVFTGQIGTPFFRVSYLLMISSLVVLCFYYGLTAFGFLKRDIKKYVLIAVGIWSFVLLEQLITGQAGGRYYKHNIDRGDRLLLLILPIYVALFTHLLMPDVGLFKKQQK